MEQCGQHKHRYVAQLAEKCEVMSKGCGLALWPDGCLVGQSRHSETRNDVLREVRRPKLALEDLLLHKSLGGMTNHLESRLTISSTTDTRRFEWDTVCTWLKHTHA